MTPGYVTSLFIIQRVCNLSIIQGYVTLLHINITFIHVNTKYTMESIGVLPQPSCSLSTTIISLFGILSTNREWDDDEEDTIKEEDCNFCLMVAKDNELFSMKTPCCEHYVHCECLKKWTMTSVNIDDSTVRCACCRTVYLDNEFCFLCLKKKADAEHLMETNCCRSTVHTTCIENLRTVLSLLSFEATL